MPTISLSLKALSEAQLGKREQWDREDRMGLSILEGMIHRSTYFLLAYCFLFGLVFYGKCMHVNQPCR